MKKLIFLLIIVMIYGCAPTIRTYNFDDIYYSRPYDPYFFYRNNLLLYNRYTPYNPYFYQPRTFIQPWMQNNPRIMDISPNKKPSQNSNVPIRKFK